MLNEHYVEGIGRRDFWGLVPEPHKPPFDHTVHISGQNLFVSAYHGFATLGNEHVPTPQRFVKFPPFAVKLGDGVVSDGSLIIPAMVTLGGHKDPDRYRLLSKIQLAEPGRGCHPGLMRNFLADGSCGDEAVSIVIPGYTDIWGLRLDKYQIHARFILLDTVTGCRSQYQQGAFCISV